MSQELITKIEEKLGGAIDLMTFDNAQQVVDYLCRYIQFKNLIITLILAFIIIVGIAVLYFGLKAGDENIDGGLGAILLFILIAVGVFLILFLYKTIIAYNFPIAAIVEWLK